MSIYTVSHIATPCTARLPRHQDVATATQPRPVTDPAAGADYLAVRCDRLGRRAIRWAAHMGEALQVIDRLRAVADRRARRLAALASVASDRDRARRQVDRQRQSADILHAALEEAEARYSVLLREVVSLREEAEILRPLAAVEQARLDKISAKRAAASRAAARRRAPIVRARRLERAKALAQEWLAALQEGKVADRLATQIRREIGAAGHRYIVLVAGRQGPTEEGERGYYTTPAGDICLHPSAYRSAYGKPIYHASTECVEVGRQWLRRSIPRLARLSCGLPR